MSRAFVTFTFSLKALVAVALLSAACGCKKKSETNPSASNSTKPQPAKPNPLTSSEKNLTPSPFEKDDPKDDRDLGTMTLTMDGASKTLGAHSVYSRTTDRRGDLFNIEGKDGSVYGLIDLNGDGRIEKSERWDGVNFNDFSKQFVGKKMKAHKARGALIILKNEMCPIVDGWVTFTEVKGGPKEYDEHAWKGEMELTIETRVGQKKVKVTFDCKFLIL